MILMFPIRFQNVSNCSGMFPDKLRCAHLSCRHWRCHPPPVSRNHGKTASFSVGLAETIAGLSVGATYNTATGKTGASVGGNAGDVSLGLSYDGSSTSISAGLLGLSVSAASGGAATVSWSSSLGGGMSFGASYGTASSTLKGTLSYSF